MISYPLRIGDVDTRVIEAGSSGEAIVLVHGTAVDFNAVLCDFLSGSLGRHQAPGVEYH
jgi:hypothetical protein